jgi:hypothetical protein
MLEEYTTDEQRSVRFVWAKGLNAKYIHKDMFPVYCGVCHIKLLITRWQMFR